MGLGAVVEVEAAAAVAPAVGLAETAAIVEAAAFAEDPGPAELALAGPAVVAEFVEALGAAGFAPADEAVPALLPGDNGPRF